MSTSYQANLHYGLKLPNNEEIEDFTGMTIISCGNGYDDKYNDYYLSITKSVISQYNDDSMDLPIDPQQLTVDPKWNDKLLKAAKKLGIDEPKIGWWLTSYIC